MLLTLVLLVAAIWALISLAVTANVNAAPRLPAATEPEADVPRVSVVVAGRNEAARLEEGIRRLMEQRGVDLEVIFVDDRSDDATPELLYRLSAEFDRLKTVRVDTLPHGWLGKCHACHLGAGRADRPWILFTDADIHMIPDLVARAIHTAECEQADHLTLYPGLNCRDALTRGVVLAWGQTLALYAPARQINRDRGRRGIGVGAFNLIRREAYIAIGGHSRLAMEVVDDVKLGLLVRRAGLRQRIYSGLDVLEAEWANSIPEAIGAVEKNWFAGVHYNLLGGLALIGTLAVLLLVAALGPLLAPGWGWIGPASLLLPIIPGFIQAKLSHWPLSCALLIPIGYVTMIAAGANSMYKTLRQGGIRWRDTFYPLQELRAGLVR